MRGPQVRPRVAELARRCGGDPPAAVVDALAAELVAAYTDDRHYHSLHHLDECLAWLAWWQAQSGEAALCELELAIWYHDLVYEPGAADNETRSASAARRAAGQLGWSPDSQEMTVQLILATAHLSGEAPLGPPDASGQPGGAAAVNEAVGRTMTALIRDIDLAILGADAARYSSYRTQVRAEYAHLPDAEYRRGRSRVLEQFLARRQIYRLPLFFSRLETRARENMAAELVELRARIGE